MTQAHVLVVDDEKNVLAAVYRLLSRQGHRVTCFESATLALADLEDSNYDLVISDYKMPGMDGVEFLAALQRSNPEIPRIMLTGEADRDAMMKSINSASVFRFLVKPFENEELHRVVKEALWQRRHNDEVSVALDAHREQKSIDYRREKELQKLEAESPGITEVNWSDNNTIVIDEF